MSAAKPDITKVAVTGHSGDYTVTITGKNFGTAPSGVPGFATTPDLAIYDAAQGLGGWWGATYPVGSALDYVSWKPDQIKVTALGAKPRDAINVLVTNPQSGNSASWGGNIPPRQASTPKITSVHFSGSGVNLHITVDGSGFGKAPPGVPGNTDTSLFRFFDFTSPAQFAAGHTGGGEYDLVTLDYASWSNDKIVIDGFGGAYGGNWSVANGDAVGIDVWNSADTSASGPQTAWGGILSTAASSMETADLPGADLLTAADQSATTGAGSVTAPDVRHGAGSSLVASTHDPLGGVWSHHGAAG